MSLKDKVLDVVEAMEDEHGAGGPPSLKSYAMMLRVALKAADPPAPTVKVFVPPAQPDYDRTFAQAMQARSRREAMEKLALEEGESSGSTYVVSGGPASGDFVTLTSARPEGSKVNMGGEEYVVRGKSLVYCPVN